MKIYRYSRICEGIHQGLSENGWLDGEICIDDDAEGDTMEASMNG